jgi:decaprenyl-phosphate phosphoribosyltransferase
MRIPQWVKNALIVVAPAAAGHLFERQIALNTVVAIASFSCVASAHYLINDLKDIEADRAHPEKRHRAIPSGQLPFPLAVGAAVVLLAGGFLLPLVLAHPGPVELILAIYMVITSSYVFGLKNVPVVELGMVASGFFLRAYAGAVASGIWVSEWFLVVISFGALFLAVGKRLAELTRLGPGQTRRVLSEYTADFLGSALTLASTVTIAGYCLWAFDTSVNGLSQARHHILPIRLSVVPVTLALLFIVRGAQAGQGAAPEELLLKNRTVQILVLVWALLLGAGIYR